MSYGNILLSICLPTYNRLQHIKRQIKYLEKEIIGKYEDKIEVIISNNASEDGTTEYLKKYEGKYLWMNILHNSTNIGGTKNMDGLICAASGKYIWLPGDDDYLKKNLIDQIIKILDNSNLSYLYLSNRSLCEKTKEIRKEGKTHCVEYDKYIDVTHSQLCKLLIDNFSNLKFQTSSIVLRENALRYQEESSKVFSDNVHADCHSLFRAVRSMQDGKSYFIKEISILNGDEISWSDQRVDIISIYDAEFSIALSNFGFSNKECRKICDRQLSAALAFYLLNADARKLWYRKGMPNFKIRHIPILVMLILRKIPRKLHLLKTYSVVNVNIEEFIP